MADATYRHEGLTAKANSDIIQNCRQGTTAKTIRMHEKSFQNSYNDYMKIRTEKSTKLSHFYYTFKNPWTPEKYLVNMKNPKVRQTLAKFRLGNHKLAVETLRYVRPKIQYEDRKCALCRLEVENEIHFLFKCPHASYNSMRNKFIDEITQKVHNFDLLTAEDKTDFIMTQEDPFITERLGQYIVQLMTNREEQLG